MITDLTNTKALAQHALECLLAQKPVIVAQGSNWKRPPGFPLPQQKTRGDAQQPYRPLAILEYVNDTLAGTIKADRLRDRHAESDDEL